MVLVLVVGDLHVPQRAAGIPDAFIKMFTPNRIHSVFITGNVGCKDTLDYFRTLTSNVYCTRGEYDTQWCSSLKDTLAVQVEGLIIGLIHGHQVTPLGDRDALATVQRKLGADVMLFGGTHISRIFEFDSSLFINPGSITGAHSGTSGDIVPSFVLLDIHGTSVTAFTYHYASRDDPEDMDEADNGTDAALRIRKKEWSKD